MKKAFIAAPLLGTMIFLASIVFVVNLSKTEASASSQVVNDAYHNRLVSLLEVYRTDLSSIFREGIVRTTEYFLLRQGWSEFDLTQNSAWYDSDSALNEDGDSITGGKLAKDVDSLNPVPSKVTYEMLRFAKCDNIRVITGQIICSIPTTSTDGGFAYDYGLPQWMKVLNQSTPFEGMFFDVANREQMKVFLPDLSSSDPVQVAANLTAYSKACSAMMKGSVFDCNNFANPVVAGKPFRCCKTNTDFNTPCTPENVVPGCEDGTFMVDVSLDNTIVYPVMPRVSASDSLGNQIRSGAIGEKDFLLPLNYPLFRYYDYAFKAYRVFAYGESESETNAGETEGVADGLCGGQNCNLVAGFNDDGFSAPYSGSDEAKDGVKTVFFDNTFAPVCTNFNQPPNGIGLGLQYTVDGDLLQGKMELAVSPDGYTASDTDYVDCTQITDEGGLSSGAGMDPLPVLCLASGSTDDTYCAYYEDLGLKFKFTDFDPAYQVDPTQENYFKWSAAPKHDDLPAP